MIPIMTYTFDTSLATKYGVNEAIMLNNFVFWIAKNEANGKHFHDGRYWTYNSVAAMEKLYPFWTTSQIRTVIASLVKQGVLLKGNYNEKPYDRTVWYAFTDEFLKSICQNSQMHLSDFANGFSENGKPIPDNKPNKKPIASTDVDAERTPAFDFKKSLISIGVSEQVAADWMTVRKAKKATNTETAFNALKNQIEKICRQQGVTADEVARFAAGKDWKGINAEWDEVKKIKQNNGTHSGHIAVSPEDDYLPGW